MNDLEKKLRRQFSEPIFEKDFRDKYRLRKSLGEGGMGSVEGAFDLNIRREIAIKKLHKEYCGDLRNAKLFLREAQLTGQLEHPNIIPIYDLGIVEDSDELFYTMKKVKGLSLFEILENIKEGKRFYINRYKLPVLLSIFLKVCDAMEFAHNSGVVHLDLKPENIMVGDFGEVLVLDWGIAKLRKKEAGAEFGFVNIDPCLWNEQDVNAGRTGVVGTPAFMAPEQAKGQADRIGSRTDVYALGGILYNILTLRAPTEGKRTTVVMKKVITGNIADPLVYNLKSMLNEDDAEAIVLNHLPRRKVPEALSAICMKALKPSLSERYSSVAALKADIYAHQYGYITEAESASWHRHLSALVLRRPYLVLLCFVCIILVLLVLLFFAS